jgi:hypothetical protein
MKKIFLLFIFFIPAITFSQVIDDFEDGDLNGWTENSAGHWAASDIDPITGTYSLKHNLDNVEDTSFITHLVSGISPDLYETIWMFNLKNGNWDPSGANFFGVYLFSDSEDLTDSPNGYVVGINFTGTSDLLSLWKVSNGSFSTVIESTFDWQAAETIGIKVTRSTLGEWTLEYDTDGGFDNLLPGGTGNDNSHTIANYTGAYFEYTSTRAGEFWLDDFSMTNPPDTDPPVILNINATSNNTILVNFNENLDQISAENTLNYSLNNGIGNPNTATLNVSDNKQVELVFSGTFTSGTTYTLSVNNVEDLFGNPTSNEEGSFLYFEAEPIDYDFEDGNIDNWTESTSGRWEASEDMPINGSFSLHHVFDNTEADNDQISVPASFVNLNSQTTTWRFQLRYDNDDPSSSNNWSCFLFSDQDASQMLPGGTINAYALGVNIAENDDTLRLWKITAGSASEIINTGIDWKDGFGSSPAVGFEVKRTISGDWSVFVDSDGGFDNLIQAGTIETDSEFIDNSYMGFYYKYTSSLDQLFWVDDVYMGEEVQDEEPPQIMSVDVISENTLHLSFNESLDQNTAENNLNYIVNQGIGNPNSAVLNAANNKQVELIFADNFIDGTTYTITVNNVEDLSGNPTINEQINFTYTSPKPINDDFEDGEISDWVQSDPSRWEASSTNPINGMYSLYHNFDNPDNGHDQISIDASSFDINTEETTWRFQVRYAWSPSSTNNWSCFLFSDKAASEMHPGGEANGYAIGVNYSGDDDMLKLWKISDGTGSEILNTGINWQEEVGINTAVGLEIKRTISGEWTVSTDLNGGFDNLVQVGNIVTDSEFNNANHLGFYYEYSSTKDTLLWIDDVYMGEAIQDVEPPVITNIFASSNNTISVNFNEALEESSAEATENYSVNNIGIPSSASLNPADNKQVDLVFSDNFVDGFDYTLTVNGVEDLYGNSCVNEIETFSYIHIAVTEVIPISKTEVDVFFNKAVEITTAETLINYSVNNGIGNPSSALLDITDNTNVHLEFSSEFNQNQFYTLTVENIEDSYGNIIDPINIEFLYYENQLYDIVINEIMCDVNPSPEYLPQHEYIEIFNNSNYNIDLEGWTFQIGDNSVRDFPGITIPSGEYGIICEDEAEDEFSDLGICIPFLNPSELTVSGKRLLIKDNNGAIIEDLTYSDEWYDDPTKDDGGWSLERIDPQNYCGQNENWTASEDTRGGSPGTENSVYALNPDFSAPEVLSIEYVSSKQINIHFSENVVRSLAEDTLQYVLNSVEYPHSALVSSESNSIVILHFNNVFNIGSNTINIQNIEDNCGNIMDEFNGSFEYERIFPLSVDVDPLGKQLIIHFSEKVDSAAAVDTSNYFVNENVGNPQSAHFKNNDSSIVLLQFENEFVLEQNYILTISNIKDVNHVVMNTADIVFVYYIPEPFDVVFTEIMADVNPEPIGVPASRYIEIYNTSDFTLNLEDWILLPEGQSEKIFPYLKINPGEYVIICEEGAEQSFLQHGITAPILGSSDITVSGKNLKLINDTTIINEINYSDEWYGDDEYDDGGWSLEIIDPLNYCGENSNWSVSIDPSGGTPGRINSVNAQNPDNSSPQLSDVQIVSSKYILLDFNENISYESGSNESNFFIDKSIGNPELSYTDESNRKRVHLLFSEQFQDEEDYSITIENLEDNCNNIIQTTGYDFSYLRIHPESVYVEDDKTLKISFSESVDYESGTNVLNYLCDNNIGNPVYVFRETADSSVVHIQFAETFPNGEELTLTIQNILDVNGNEADIAEFPFSYYIPVRNDIIINEVLFNPFKDGSDFVEIYNRSEYKIDLKNLYPAKRDNKDSIIIGSPLSEHNFHILREHTWHLP